MVESQKHIQSGGKKGKASSRVKLSGVRGLQGFKNSFRFEKHYKQPSLKLPPLY